MLKDDLLKIYSQFPEMPKGKCKQCGQCCGIVGCTIKEKHLINRTIKKENLNLPYINEKMGNGHYFLPHNELNCAYLTKEKTCPIYNVRPLICRIFGVEKNMVCFNAPKEAKYNLREKMTKYFGKINEEDRLKLIEKIKKL